MQQFTYQGFLHTWPTFFADWHVILLGMKVRFLTEKIIMLWCFLILTTPYVRTVTFCFEVSRSLPNGREKWGQGCQLGQWVQPGRQISELDSDFFMVAPRSFDFCSHNSGDVRRNLSTKSEQDFLLDKDNNRAEEDSNNNNDKTKKPLVVCKKWIKKWEQSFALLLRWNVNQATMV